MLSTALDIEIPGTDRDTGAGIVMAYPALQAAGSTGKAYLEFDSYVALEDCGNSDGLLEPGETGSLTVNLTNNGLLNATGITTYSYYVHA